MGTDCRQGSGSSRNLDHKKSKNVTEWREGNQHATYSNFPTSLSFSRQGGEESASILNGSSSLAAFRNNLCSFMLSLAAHKSFSSASLTFVRINRLYCSSFQSHSMRFPFPQHLPGHVSSSAYIYIWRRRCTECIIKISSVSGIVKVCS